MTATKEETIAFQDKLKAKFEHEGVVGGRRLMPILRDEERIGGEFWDKWYGHRVLTDSFLDFCVQTFEKQCIINNNWVGPQSRIALAA